MIRIQLLVVLLSWIGVVSNAQTHLRIHHSRGNHTDVPIAQIDSITFVDGDTILEVAVLTGSWLWGDTIAGYYELLTFNEDHTYMGYDNYFVYGFDTMTYGWYSQWGAMLTLQSNGFGYNHRYNWYVTGLTDNALEVMTKMGPFTYYRLQPEVLKLQAGGTPLSCEGGGSFIFADGVLVRIEDNKLYGISPGTTYIQKQIVDANLIYAYKVVVE